MVYSGPITWSGYSELSSFSPLKALHHVNSGKLKSMKDLSGPFRLQVNVN